MSEPLLLSFKIVEKLIELPTSALGDYIFFFLRAQVRFCPIIDDKEKK